MLDHRRSYCLHCDTRPSSACASMMHVFFCLTLIVAASQRVVYSGRGGPWSEGATWEGGIVPAAIDSVVIRGTCQNNVEVAREVIVDTAVDADRVTLNNSGICPPGLVVAPAGRLQTRVFAAMAGSFVLLDGGELSGDNLTFDNMTLGGAGRITGSSVVGGGTTLVPGVVPAVYVQCWPGYSDEARTGDLVFSVLQLAGGQALITSVGREYLSRAAADSNVSSISAGQLTVAANTSFGFALAANGPFLRWTTLRLFGNLTRLDANPFSPCLFGTLLGIDDGTTPPAAGGELCPTALGVLSSRVLGPARVLPPNRASPLLVSVACHFSLSTQGNLPAPALTTRPAQRWLLLPVWKHG